MIAASLETVWAVITDINLPAEFSNEFSCADWIDDGLALGARFTGRNRHDSPVNWPTAGSATRSFPKPLTFFSTRYGPARPQQERLR